ncbi:MAG: sigma-70 family RNA polymerase sigma factor, partial [Candidatus Latescibacteria bacterium]|nr:sigma-70 family RNA polymerase sigma factor [Candidatus Latescibacterota bacterium]
TPEDMTLKHEQLRLVKQGIRSLPKPQRRAVWLRYMKDFSYQEIVQELNVPLGTVKIWLHRGKHQLKRELEKLMLLQMETGMNV